MRPRRTDRSVISVKERGENICFVAMDFDQKFDFLFDEIISRVIIDVGLIPVRSDRVISAGGNVLDEIVDIIRTSKLLIVDITGLNPNVLIEIGIAHALSKTMILMTQDGQVPFDLQPRRVIYYTASAAGKREARKRLSLALRSAVYPSEDLLRDMLSHGSDRATILIGNVSTEHIAGVWPPVDTAYMQRLATTSSELYGVWEIGLAYQKIAWATGTDKVAISVANSDRAPLSVLENSNGFILGGPGVNPFFRRVLDIVGTKYKHGLDIRPTPASQGGQRYRIYQGDQVYPEDQDAWLERHIDVGMLLRFPNPFCAEGMIWIAAGIRTFGTEAAIQALVSPALIKLIGQNAKLKDSSSLLWAVIRVNYDPKSQTIGDIALVGSGNCGL